MRTREHYRTSLNGITRLTTVAQYLYLPTAISSTHTYLTRFNLLQEMDRDQDTAILRKAARENCTPGEKIHVEATTMVG